MCPIKSFTVSKSRDPWITNKFLEEIRDKDLAMKKARKNGKLEHLLLTKDERNRVGRMVDNARATLIMQKKKDVTGVTLRDSGKLFLLFYLARNLVNKPYLCMILVLAIRLNKVTPLIL